MPQILVLSEADVMRLLTPEECIDAVKAAFIADAQGSLLNFPVVREPVPDGTFGVKSGYYGPAGSLGLKAGGYWPGNEPRGLPNHQSTIVLFGAATGMPTALIHANCLTEWRTSAAGVIAIEALANPRIRQVTIIGAGVQARGQIRALLSRLSVESLIIWTRNPEHGRALARQCSLHYDIPTNFIPDAAIAVEQADVVITATPSTVPVIRREWVCPGQHINAIGSDTRGKQELDPNILKMARVFPDSLAQAMTLGELQHLTHAEVSQVVTGTLGEVLAGKKAGRTTPQDVTVFDGTGVTFQDLAVAELLRERAEKESIGTVVAL